MSIDKMFRPDKMFRAFLCLFSVTFPASEHFVTLRIFWQLIYLRVCFYTGHNENS